MPFMVGGTILPAVRIATRRLKTNTVSNTAFRGFGGPQGMLAMERVVDAVAWHLGKDPLDVRLANLYAEGRDTTPFGMVVEDHDTGRALIEHLVGTSDYRARRQVIAAYNAGPNAVARWDINNRAQNDPLLYIESIPYAETRGYVTTVLRNYWMYERQSGEQTASLKALAQGAWPRFPSTIQASVRTGRVRRRAVNASPPT